MTMKKQLTGTAVALLLATTVLGAAQGVSADTISDAQSAISANKAAGSSILSQVQSATEKVAAIDNKVSNKTLAIQETQDNLNKATAKIATYKKQIAEAEANVVKREKAMKAQLVSLQKEAGDSVTGNIYIDFALNASDFSDLVSRSFTINKLNNANKDALAAVTEAKTKLSDLKKAAEANKTKLEDSKAALTREKAELDELKAEAQKQAVALQAKVDANADELNALQGQLDTAKAAAQPAPKASATSGSRAAAPSSGKVAVSGSLSGLSSQVAQYIGVPYAWGGSSPSGFDCSGLVAYAARQIGVSLPRTTQAQSTVGAYVPVSGLQAGDLVFWGGVGSAYHVGVYIGNGQYIHSPSPGQSVKVQSMSYFAPSFGRRI